MITKEHIESLSDSELKELYYLESNKENNANIQQLTMKTQINGIYGALANKHFSLYNLEIAKAITGNGRYYIKLLANLLNEKLGSMIDYGNFPVIAGDTDSVVFDTVLCTDKGDIQIGDLYNSTDTEEQVSEFGNNIKKVHGLKSLSFNKDTEKTEYRDVKYIMKHKVKKRMFKITHNDKSTTVTEDHSVIVKRGNKFLDIKPKDISEGDKILRLQDELIYSSEFNVEDLGVQEIEVYDIEVEDNHNFFANDILVHNSCYVCLAPFAEKYLEKHPDKNDQEVTDFLDKFSNKVIIDIIDKSIKMYADNLNSYNREVIGVEREVIANRANFHAKKNYIMSVIDDEGTRYHEKPKIKMTGVELKKSSIPPFVRDQFNSVIDILLFKENEDIIQFIKDSKEEMFNEKIYRLSKTSSVSSLDYKIGDKSIPINSRASLVYNKYIKDMNLMETYESIQPGDKIKLVYLNEANPTMSNVIAYKDPRFIELLKEYIDYNTIWEKFFEKSLQNMTDPIDWNLKIAETLEYDEW